MSMEKAVLIIMVKGGGHYPQKLLIEYLRNLKYKIILARNDEDKLNEFDEYADYIINVDVYNVNQLITEVTNYSIHNKIDAVVSVNEYAVEQTAMLCNAMGITGLNIDAAKRCRNKYLSRVCLSEGGIKQPKFDLVRSSEGLIDMDKKLGYPFIIKPLNFAGSCCVTKINNKSELDRAIENLQEIKKSAPSNNHFVDSMQNYWIAEQYLDGFEISVECIINDYECTVAAIHDKMVSIDESAFLEQYFVTPSPRIIKEMESTIIEESKKILKVINFNTGIAHLEFRVGTNGPVLLEVNARIGGLLISASVLNTKGINLAECLMKLSLNQELNLKCDDPKPTAFCTIFTGKGYVKKIHGINQAKMIEGLVYMDIWINEGEYVDDIMDGYGIVLMYEGETSGEAYLKIRQAVELIHYEME